VAPRPAAARTGSPGLRAMKRETTRAMEFRGAVGVLIATLLGGASPAAAQLVTDPGTVVQTIDTSLWSPPASDAAGITYRPDTGELLMCDSEIEESVEGITHYQGVNVWTLTRTGEVVGTTTTVPWSNEPTGIGFDPAGGRLWVSDDVRESLYELELGPDGVLGTNDDKRVRLRGYVDAGCNDLEDVAYDVLDGHLYVVSGSGQEICRVGPGPNEVFDGMPPWGDDELTTLELAPLGILDPEGIVHDPFWNTFVVADRTTRALYELTPEGGLLRKIAVNFPGGSKISGVTIAPGSTNPSLRNYYVTDRGVDNNLDPFAIDGRIYEVVAVPLGGNGAPVVDAGAPRTLAWPENSTALDGFVSDDGHPYPPSTVLALWSQLAGPGPVAFENASDPRTSASFPAPGEYLLQLAGNDSAAQAIDTVAITVGDSATLSVATLGPGRVTLDPPGGRYPPGTAVSVKATPDPGAFFDGFGGALSGTATPQHVIVEEDALVEARFSAVTGGGGCGIGPELAAALPLLAWLRSRWRRRP